MKNGNNPPSLALRGVTAALALLGTLGTTYTVVEADDGQKRIVGRQVDGTVVLPTNQILDPAGSQVEFRGRPNQVALSADGKTAAFLNGAYKAIIVIDPATGTIKQEFDAAGASASYAGLAYSRDGLKLYASQANGRIVVASVLTDGSLALDGYITLPKSTVPYAGREDGNPLPGSLAVSDDGRELYVVLSRNNSLAVIDLASRTVVREIPVGNAPHTVVLAGRKAYVSNQGGRKAAPGDVTNDSSGTAIVSDPTSGYAATGSVSVVDLDSGATVGSIEVGLQPTALLLNGYALYVANTNSDTVSVIDTRTDKLVKTILVQPFPGRRAAAPRTRSRSWARTVWP